jgi:PTS system nitrogen regulatory IIA component
LRFTWGEKAAMLDAMRLTDYISRDRVFVVRPAADKQSFLETLVGLVQQQCPELDRQVLLERLLAREEEVTTGIGHGVAIPHATMEGLPETCCFIAQTPDGLDFLSLDASPVHITFLLLSPPGATGRHIRLLARIARLTDNEKYVYAVATAESADEVYALTVAEDSRHV